MQMIIGMLVLIIMCIASYMMLKSVSKKNEKKNIFISCIYFLGILIVLYVALFIVGGIIWLLATFGIWVREFIQYFYESIFFFLFY